MAELRRRKGDGDTNDVEEANEVGSGGLIGSSASNFQPTISSNADKETLLEPLQLSDSATADSSDHVSINSNSNVASVQILLIFPNAYCAFCLFNYVLLTITRLQYGWPYHIQNKYKNISSCEYSDSNYIFVFNSFIVFKYFTHKNVRLYPMDFCTVGINPLVDRIHYLRVKFTLFKFTCVAG